MQAIIAVCALACSGNSSGNKGAGNGVALGGSETATTTGGARALGGASTSGGSFSFVSGGASATGGKLATATAGSLSTGGSSLALATGGGSATGGASATGGSRAAPTGGTLGTGGSVFEVGGSLNTGGRSAATTGGANSTGGSSLVATGGMTTTGGSRAVTTGGAPAGGSAPQLPENVYTGIQWADTSGNPIQAHGGGVIKVGNDYYWFGENRNPNGTFYAVSCYRSSDLVHWEFRNNVLTQNSAAELKPANIERPKVIYNTTTKKYVMWMHWENGSDYGASRAAVASCDTVDGNYTYQGSARPLVSSGVVDHGTVGYQSRDCTLFADTDGKAYFVSASNENYDLNLYLLKSDYLSIDSLAAVLFKGGHREAPVLWKRNNVYFLLTSAATGWNPNQAQYATSSSLTSGWSSLVNVGDSTTFHSQSTFAIPVQGSTGTSYVYMGDRWAGAWSGPVNDSTYVWIPISFPSNTSLAMSWANTLTIDTGAGTVAGSTNHFKFVNKATAQAMSVEGASTTDHASIVQTPYTSGPEQQWNLNYDSAGYFNVSNVRSAMVLDVASGSTADGASIIQYTSNDGENQKWRVIDKGSGNYQLLNKQSGKVAELPANITAAGTQLDQRGSNAGLQNQLWQMSVAK